MPNKNQPSLDTVLELARQNVLSESEAKANELAGERHRQLNAIERVTSARDQAKEAFDNLPISQARATASQIFTDIINA